MELCKHPMQYGLHWMLTSLCSQSEGHEHVANMASALAHDFVGFLAVFGRHNIRLPHFASKVSYNVGAATDDYVVSAQISAARALLPILIFYLEHPKIMRRPSILLLFNERPPVFDRVSSCVRLCFVLRSVVPRPAFAKKYRD